MALQNYETSKLKRFNRRIKGVVRESIINFSLKTFFDITLNQVESVSRF